MKEWLRTIDSIWNLLVLPLLGLLVWITVVTKFTTFGAADALLLVLVFSVWYGMRQIEARLATVELYLARIAIQQVPGAARLEVISQDGATRTLLSMAPDDKPRIIDPRAPRPRTH